MEEDRKQDDVSIIEKIRNFLAGDRKKDARLELHEMIDEVEEIGIINESQGEMIQNILVLKDTMVREIMVPKVDMVCVGSSNPVTEVVKTIAKSGYSTIPVFDGSPDNIVGIVHAKDILVNLNQCLNEFNVTDIMRQPYFVPEGKKLIDLLKEFKDLKGKIAIVIDEYGSVDGLVTLEDILNEIVETEDDENSVQDTGDGSFIVDPKMSIDEFMDEFSLDLPRGEYDTVGGFIISTLERIPQKGEIFEFNDLVFEISEADKKRISKLKLKIHRESKD
ncbi:MAG TPA: hemolysin family protein [Desulfomonilia bacterium]